MKRVLYRDFTFAYRIYAEHLDSSRAASGPHILFLSHELSLTRAPRMLLSAAKLVLATGGFPVIVARETHVGAAEMFDEESGFRFECGSAASLAGQLLAAHERRDELPELGRAARRIFERELTLEAFGARFLAMIGRQIAAALPKESPAIRSVTAPEKDRRAQEAA